MTKNKKYSNFLGVLVKSGKSNRIILAVLVVFVFAYAMVMFSSIANAEAIQIKNSVRNNIKINNPTSYNANKVNTKQVVQKINTNRRIKPITVFTNKAYSSGRKVQIVNYKPSVTTYQVNNRVQYNRYNSSPRVKTSSAIPVYKYSPSFLPAKTSSKPTIHRTINQTPTINQNKPKKSAIASKIGVNYNNARSTWKTMDSRSINRKSVLSNGANCIRYSNGSKGCFPLYGRPGNYKWNSYSKGTCLQDCSNYAGKDHQAIDIYTAHGTSIFSVWEGIVIAAYWHDVGGNTILIRHAKFGTVSVYTHLSKMLVRNGEKVRAGKLIGQVGATGSSASGSHLHFRIHDINHPGYKQSRWAPLTEYETVRLAPFRGIRKGNFHGEHLVDHL